jgi:hypothetical protein
MNLTQIIKDVGVKNTKIEDARAVSNPADTHKLAALTVANNVSLTQKQDSELSSGYNGIKGGDISDDLTAGLTKDASAPTVVENVGDGSDVYVDKDVPISNSAATIRKHQRTGE